MRRVLVVLIVLLWAPKQRRASRGSSLAAKRRLYGISSAIWYSWRDVPGRAWFDYTGLFDLDSAPKPAWSALVRLTGGSLAEAISPPAAGYPPAIAGRITTVSDSEAPVSRPSSTRTSSSFK
jgi:hypothetical protein